MLKIAGRPRPTEHYLYIFVLRSRIRTGLLYRVFTSASIRRHFSWFSMLSRFHASAIACAGDNGPEVQATCFHTLLDGDGDDLAVI
jgi:hypothetical protein